MAATVIFGVVSAVWVTAVVTVVVTAAVGTVMVFFLLQSLTVFSIQKTKHIRFQLLSSCHFKANAATCTNHVTVGRHKEIVGGCTKPVVKLVTFAIASTSMNRARLGRP